MKVALIVPTYNAGELWKDFLSAYKKQSAQIDRFIVIDSSSSDYTVHLAKEYGAEIYNIPSSEFNHGGTRNYAASLCHDMDIMIFMTQDAVLQSENSLSEILLPFSNPNVAAVCGRQIAHKDANPISIHARIYNYSSFSSIKTKMDISTHGVKTAFMSNSFSAYRREHFWRVGGFPQHTILAEDMYIAGKLLLSNMSLFYSADAIVYHSHNYSPLDEFRRYFDIGVFHANELWVQEEFGGVSGEGFKFVKSEISYLFSSNNKIWIPRALVTNAMKFLGYKLGKKYRLIPKLLCMKLGMYKSYWL